MRSAKSIGLLAALLLVAAGAIQVTAWAEITFEKAKLRRSSGGTRATTRSATATEPLRTAVCRTATTGVWNSHAHGRRLGLRRPRHRGRMTLGAN